MVHPDGRRRVSGRMEDVLDLYEEPYDPAYPMVCLDERPVVLHTQTRSPLPAQPGVVERRDDEYVHEYVRKGPPIWSCWSSPLRAGDISR